jgi:uncharacterized protein
MPRHGVQFHWHNRGYRDFEDFLATMRSTKRKAIRKERREVERAGLEFRTLTGPELSVADLEAFYPFYVATVDKRWGSAYLTRDFFRRLATDFAERIVLVTVRQDGELVGAALNLKSGDTLYGRLWGCRREFDFLHFEACYYRAIEHAISHGMARVEAGAQGMHKLQRGYEPVVTRSAHYIRDPGLAAPVKRFLAQERRSLEHELGRAAPALALPSRAQGLRAGDLLRSVGRSARRLPFAQRESGFGQREGRCAWATPAGSVQRWLALDLPFRRRPARRCRSVQNH